MTAARVSLAGLLATIVVGASCLAAMKGADGAWAGGMTSVTWFLLVVSWLGVGFGRGARRAFWVGFALLGWTYVALLYVPALSDAVGMHLLGPRIAEPLESWLRSATDRKERAAGAACGASSGYRSATAGWVGTPSPVAQLTSFATIVVMLEALLWALLGGVLARYFAGDETARRVPPAPAPVAPPPPPVEPPPAPFRLGAASEAPR